MKIIKTTSYDLVSKKAATIIAAEIIANPKAVLGLATGGSPIGTYEELVKLYTAGIIDFSDIVSFNLDEYWGIPKEHEQSYNYFMKEHFFSKINIKSENTHLPNGMGGDAKIVCEEYGKAIENAGGVDIQLLGIGRNAHIGFNEPAKAFRKGINLVDLSEDTIKANSIYFEKAEDVPKKAISLSEGTIMSAKKILLIASGEDKIEAIEKACYGPVTPEVPASVLQYHKDVTIIYSAQK